MANRMVGVTNRLGNVVDRLVGVTNRLGDVMNHVSTSAVSHLRKIIPGKEKNIPVIISTITGIVNALLLIAIAIGNYGIITFLVVPSFILIMDIPRRCEIGKRTPSIEYLSIISELALPSTLFMPVDIFPKPLHTAAAR